MARRDERYARKAQLTGGGVDHGLLAGLGDDDHSQYHNDTRGDLRYYTQTQVDALNLGDLANVAVLADPGAGADGWVLQWDDGATEFNLVALTPGVTDHTLLTNIGTNTHAQIDTHIADATLHFTEASIDHTAITNVGTNTHAQIDTHIAETGVSHLPAGTTTSATLRWTGTAWAETTGLLSGTGNNKIEVTGANPNIIINANLNGDARLIFEENSSETIRLFFDESVETFKMRLAAGLTAPILVIEQGNASPTIAKFDPNGECLFTYNGHTALATTNQGFQATAGTGVAAVCEISADTGQVSAINFEESTTTKYQIGYFPASSYGHIRTADTGDEIRLTNVVDGDFLRASGTGIGFNGSAPTAPQTYTLTATSFVDRTLLASGSATTTNNNNVLAALITDLKANGLIS